MKRFLAVLAFLALLPAYAMAATQNSSNNVAAAGLLTGSTLAAGVTSSSLTAVGTIGTGTWHGTILDPAYGGTGANESAATGIGQWSSGTYSVSAALASGTTAVTQSGSDNSTLVATTAQVQAAITAVSTPNAILRLYSNTAAVGNPADLTEDTLLSYTMPANTLAAAGDKIHTQAYCILSNNTHNRTTRLYFGSMLLIDIPNVSVQNYQFYMDMTVTKTGSNTQIVSAFLAESIPPGNASSSVATYYQLGTETDTSSIVVKTTGATNVATANDVTCTQMSVEFIPH